MKRNTISGIVTEVEPIHDLLTFLTLEPVADEGWTWQKLPVYMNFQKLNLEGRSVDITTTRRGFLRRRVEQEISGSNFTYSTELTQRQIDAITDYYKAVTDR